MPKKNTRKQITITGIDCIAICGKNAACTVHRCAWLDNHTVPFHSAESCTVCALSADSNGKTKKFRWREERGVKGKSCVGAHLALVTIFALPVLSPRPAKFSLITMKVARTSWNLNVLAAGVFCTSSTAFA